MATRYLLRNSLKTSARDSTGAVQPVLFAAACGLCPGELGCGLDLFVILPAAPKQSAEPVVCLACKGVPEVEPQCLVLGPAAADRA